MELLPGGEGRVVKPEERQEYASLVRQARMTEFTKQVKHENNCFFTPAAWLGLLNIFGVMDAVYRVKL